MTVRGQAKYDRLTRERIAAKLDYYSLAQEHGAKSPLALAAKRRYVSAVIGQRNEAGKWK